MEMSEEEFNENYGGINIINPAIVDERITKYLNENYDEIIAMIDKKIASQVKDAVNSAFRDTWRTESFANKTIKPKVDELLQARVDEINIDDHEIKELLDRRIRSYIKKAKISISD